MRGQIANCLTCCNLLCGCIATVLAIESLFCWALAFIVLGCVFDFCDGFVARLLGVSSPIGKELDSLADVVTSGVAPSAMLFTELTFFNNAYLPYVAFLIAAFSAVRLAKFNLDSRQSSSFLGLPTPANALFWASLLTSCGGVFLVSYRGAVFLIMLLAMSCYLLVSEVPMFAMKFKTWSVSDGDNKVKYAFIVFSVLMLVLCWAYGIVVMSIALIVVAYILLSVIMWLVKR